MADENRRREDEEGAEPQLKVTDRRLFGADGTLRDEAALEDEAPETTETISSPQEPSSPSVPDREEPAAESDAGFRHEPVEEPEGVDFTMLINAMAQPALLFLGELQHPGSGERQIDLEQARLQIDMLQLLRVKCRGNLSREEESLLDRILYQLRMLYVARSNTG